MDVVELTQKLVQINSENPPGKERKVAEAVKEFMAGTDFKLTEIEKDDGRPILIFEKGEGDGLMLNGHLDTVPASSDWEYDPFGGEIANGKLYGRGSVDMKGGVAAILCATREFSGKELKNKLALVFVPGEETNYEGGTRYLTSKKKGLLEDIKYGVVAEPTNMNVEIAQKGITDVKVVFKGVSAHGSKPHLGDNAILKAVEFINELQNLSKSFDVSDEVLGEGTVNVGVIKGGVKVNMVPDRCEVEIDRRRVPGESKEEVLKQVKELLEKTDTEAEVEIILSRPPMKVSEGSEIRKTMERVSGGELTGTSGYTEAELFFTRCGIDCVVCGPGSMDLAHVKDEFMEIEQLERAVDVYRKLINELCL